MTPCLDCGAIKGVDGGASRYWDLQQGVNRYFINGRTTTIVAQEQWPRWYQRMSNDNDEITLPMEETTLAGGTSTSPDNLIPDRVDLGSGNNSSGLGVRARVNLQLSATNWLFSGFHLHEAILYVSRRFSRFCIEYCCNPIVLPWTCYVSVVPLWGM